MASNYSQYNYRGRDDNYGLNVNNGWHAALNTGWTNGTGTTNRFRVRFMMWNNNNRVDNETFQMEYQRNALGWNDVTSVSSVVRSTGGLPTDGAACSTQLLTGNDPGSGAWENDGSYDEGDGLLSNWAHAKGGFAEFELCAYIRDADVNHLDTISLRLYATLGGNVDTYSVTATITVSKPGAGRIPDLMMMGCGQ